MVEMKVSYAGDLRCISLHGPSGAELPTDAPRDNMGKGQAFSPTDLLATSLATCILTTMAIYARKGGYELSGASAVVSKEMTATGPRRVQRLTVSIHVDDALTGEQQQKLEAAAATCPVRKSLHPDVEVVERITFGSSPA